MKVVSWKTLFATILGLVFIIYKLFNFDGIVDVLWIVIFIRPVVKGFKIAFSQEAYDED